MRVWIPGSVLTGYEPLEQPRLGFASLLELLGERFRANPKLLRQLNPGFDWDQPKAGVIVRPIAGYGLPEWLRVTIGTPAENERFLASLKAALGR